VDYIQFDTNRVGGLTQARKIAALRRSALDSGCAARGADAQLSHRDGESQLSDRGVLSARRCRGGNELFWYIFKGEPMPKDGFIDLDENTPGLGLSVDEAALGKFTVTE
jgi:L-alanine-DL-glutamate epimerase-like enolase superfamily enzyme